MDLGQLQREHKEWRDRNFPTFRDTDGLLGVTEEVGELAEALIGHVQLSTALGRLAHSHLKTQQGIRGDAATHRAAAEDAVADVVIFLTSYCNTNDIDLAATVEKTWSEVRDRDWITNPETGASSE